MTNGLVSVLIPCYNQEHLIGETIESVLAQTYRQFEIVVVDDCSSDDTAEAARRYPGVRVITQQHLGASAARNRGIRESKGEFIVLLDGDDRLLPHALETGVDALTSHPECAFAYGACRFTGPDGSPQPTPRLTILEKDHYLELLKTNYIWMPAQAMHRRSTLESPDWFDPTYDTSSDYDLYLRVTREHPVFCHGETVAEYRQHGSNTSLNGALMLANTIPVLKRQWRYVRGNRRLEEAYRAGMKRWRSHYGDAMANSIRTSIRRRSDWGRTGLNLLHMARYCPEVLLAHMSRKLGRVLQGEHPEEA